MTSASKSYIAHSTPSTTTAPGTRSALHLLQSTTTRKNLTEIHAVSGSAAKLSNKATTTVDKLIKRAIGSGSSSSSSSSSSYSSAVKGKTEAPADTVKSSSLQPEQASTAPLRTPTPVALIKASMEASAMRLVESGGAAVSAAVTHKYGATAGENAALAGRTARNVVLVYVDIHGLSWRVIVKRIAKAMDNPD
jgi:spartin